LGSALIGNGLGHAGEAVLADLRIKKRASRELIAQGVNESLAEFDERHTQLVKEKRAEEGYSTLHKIFDAVETLGGARLLKTGYNDLSDRVQPIETTNDHR